MKTAMAILAVITMVLLAAVFAPQVKAGYVPNYKWNHVYVPLTSCHINDSDTDGSAITARHPNFEQFRQDGSTTAHAGSGVWGWTFDASEINEIHCSASLPSGWVGRTVYPAIKWETLHTDGAGKNVKLGIEYTIANIDGAFPVTVSSTTVDAVGATQYVNKLTDIPGSGLPLATSNIIATMQMRVYRDGSDTDNDTYTDDDIGIHGVVIFYQTEPDTAGSRQRLTY